MTQDEMKLQVAQAAIQYVVPGTIIGVGIGSTANFLLMNSRRSKVKSKVR